MLGCCRPESGEPAPNKKLPNGDIVEPDRVCTDVGCLLAFIAFWIGMFTIVGVAVSYGDVNAITYGSDYKGNRCGLGKFANMSKTFYPRMDLDLAEQSAFIVAKKPWLVRLYGLCVHECLSESTVAIGQNDNILVTSRVNYNWQDNSSNASVDIARYWPAVLPEVSILNRCLPYSSAKTYEDEYCFRPTCRDVNRDCALRDLGDGDSWWLDPVLPKKTLDKCVVKKTKTRGVIYDNYQQSYVSTYVQGTLGNFFAFVQALRASYVEIGVTSILICSLLCFTWLVLMRFFAAPMIYFMIVVMGLTIITITGITFTYSCFVQNDWVYNCTAVRTKTYSYAGVSLQDQNAYRAGFFFFSFCFLVYVCLLAYLRKAIRIGIAITQESAKVIANMPLMFALPPVAVAAALGLLLYFLYIGAYIATAYRTFDQFDFFNRSNTSEVDKFIQKDDQRALYFLMWYHLIGVIWALSVVVGITCMSIAGAVAFWYFYRDDPERRRHSPVVQGLRTTVQFHLGTVCFGALLLTIAQCLRLLLEWIDEQTKSLQQANPLARLALRCVKCCMWCLEKFLKFVTGYIYIYTSMMGTSFCKSARASFSLIMKYPGQVYVNHMVQWLLKLLMSVTIPFLCGIFCYYWVNGLGKINAVYCALIATIIAFFVTRLFAAVFEVVIETIFLCAFRDREKYKLAHTPDSIRVAFHMNKDVWKDPNAEKTALLSEGTEVTPPPQPGATRTRTRGS